MTDFSPHIPASQALPDGVADALLALNDDAEIIEAVTLVLYPDWTPAPSGEPDPRLDSGRDTWLGMTATLTTPAQEDAHAEAHR